jgi:hypothetical protein
MIQEEAVVAWLKQYPGNSMEVLGEVTKESSVGVSQCPDRDSKRVPPEYESRALPLHQPAEFNPLNSCGYYI